MEDWMKRVSLQACWQARSLGDTGAHKCRARAVVFGEPLNEERIEQAHLLISDQVERLRCFAAVGWERTFLCGDGVFILDLDNLDILKTSSSSRTARTLL